MPDDTDDPLADLRERIRATQEAAERLAGEASEARETHRAGGTPPNGWRTTEDHEARTGELQALVALLESLRGLVPTELQEQLTEVVRQVLLLVRALIDWLVERMEGRAPGSGRGTAGTGPDVQDIPIA